MENLHEETCCNCGVAFFITKGFHSLLIKSGQSFYCPNGHGQHYSENERKIWQRKLDEKQQTIYELENQIRLLKVKPKRGRPAKKK